MQVVCPQKFLNGHSASVVGVAFSPKDRQIFSTCGHDGKIILYRANHASFHSIVTSYSLTSNPSIASAARLLSGIKFTADGETLAVASGSKKLIVIDVARGSQVIIYSGIGASPDQISVPIATDHNNPSLVACPSDGGKGIILIDIRSPSPAEHFQNIHSTPMKDISFLDSSWTSSKSSSNTSGILSMDSLGNCKIIDMKGQCIQNFEVDSDASTITPTPEKFNSAINYGFGSHFVSGGSHLSTFTPESTDSIIGNCFNHGRLRKVPNSNFQSTITRLKYSSNGSTLFCADDNGHVRRYHRLSNEYVYLGELINHKAPVNDFAISLDDEFLATASSDRKVGIITLDTSKNRSPGYFEICQTFE